MSLTDDPAVPAKFVFPAGHDHSRRAAISSSMPTTIAAPGLHAGFALDQDGDDVCSSTTSSRRQALLDSITFGPQAADLSIGRTGAALDVWTLCTPTLGAANAAGRGLRRAPAALRINEWLGNPDYLFDDDFLELYNPAAQPVALGGCRVTDDFINYPTQSASAAAQLHRRRQRFCALQPKGDAAPGNADELPFRIDAHFGWLALIGENGTIVDRVDIVVAAADASRGRAPDGGGDAGALRPARRICRRPARATSRRRRTSSR